MKALELKVPPVVTFLVAAIAIYKVPAWFPQLTYPVPFKYVVSGCFFVLSGVFGMSALWHFKQVKTTVNPVIPSRAKRVVVHGIYRVSRNPMYMGLLWLLIAEAYWMGSALNLIVLLAFIAFMNRFQIQPEERMLEQKFDETYRKYKRRVRRWI